jgi:hypothetical protein
VRFAPLDISAYSPGRFAYLMESPFAGNVWAFLTDNDNLSTMLSAVDSGMPAILPLRDEIEVRFGPDLASADYRDDDAVVLVNNMIKQIMELCGYEFVACGIVHGARFFTSSGVYRKLGEA